ncbi:MAG: hypothetical protein IPI46_00670 [Bacteroidetes bacterium]|nr:hypothetical protein [Bacteroidota bacterium]
MKKNSTQLLLVMLTLVTILNACHVAKSSLALKEDQVLEREDGMHKAWLQELEKTADPHTGNIPVERMNTAIEYAKQVRKKEAHKNVVQCREFNGQKEGQTTLEVVLVR